MKKEVTSPPSRTNWDRIDRMRDEDIDFSDLPETPPEKFAQALVREGLRPAARKWQAAAIDAILELRQKQRPASNEEIARARRTGRP